MWSGSTRTRSLVGSPQARRASYAVLCLVALVPVAALGVYVVVSLRRVPAQDQGGSSPV